MGLPLAAEACPVMLQHWDGLQWWQALDCQWWRGCPHTVIPPPSGQHRHSVDCILCRISRCCQSGAHQPQQINELFSAGGKFGTHVSDGLRSQTGHCLKGKQTSFPMRPDSTLMITDTRSAKHKLPKLHLTFWFILRKWWASFQSGCAQLRECTQDYIDSLSLKPRSLRPWKIIVRLKKKKRKENCTNHPERHNGRYTDGQGAWFGASNVLCVSARCPLVKLWLGHLSIDFKLIWTKRVRNTE